MVFCNINMDYKIFKNNIKITIPAVKNYKLPNIYKCKMPQNLKNDHITDSIAMNWSGLPTNGKYLQLKIMDTTCIYGCNKNCKFTHWNAKFPINNDGEFEEFFKIKNNKRIGIKKNGAKSIKKYILNNDFKLKTYVPFCTPPKQKHSFVIEGSIFNKNHKIIAKAISDPFLI